MVTWILIKGKFFIPVKDQGDSFLYGIPAVGTSHWNSSSTGKQLMYTIANLIIQIFVNGLGTDTVAAWGTFAKIDAIYWMVVNSFGIAITTFVGQNYGAGKIQRMRKSVKVCLLMSYGSCNSGKCSTVWFCRTAI